MLRKRSNIKFASRRNIEAFADPRWRSQPRQVLLIPDLAQPDDPTSDPRDIDPIDNEGIAHA